jgi:putative hydrolase of the HAD superfamily
MGKLPYACEHRIDDALGRRRHGPSEGLLLSSRLRSALVNEPRVPFEEIDTIFFDVGNTLVSIDFEWISEELGKRGVVAAPESLRRAEAAARPRVSEGIANRADKETQDTFTFYFGLVLQELEVVRVLGAERIQALARELTPVLRGPGLTARLWSWMLPGVPEALEAMRDGGLQLAVVSNSDGSVEQSLVASGLRDYFAAVLDSHIVGHEKPDPRIFEKALEMCGADPARTVHVGDMYAADVVGARAAGVHPVLLDPFDDWKNVDCVTLPDIVILGQHVLLGRNENRQEEENRNEERKR